ncbi:MAG: hypothetical protein RR324_08930 [Cellulosilyticaceae bacterium]
MLKSMRCNHCGYDMCGPEYLSNTIDSSLYNQGSFYIPEALLTLSSKSDKDISCPFCNTKGEWSR